MIKIWHKSLHKRKQWKQLSVTRKILFYMQPFADHFIEIWREPLPFPTIFKFVFSFIPTFFLMLPIVYPVLVVITYYGILQYFIENDLAIQYPSNIDLLHYVENAFNISTSNEKYELFLNLFIAKCRYITLAIASSIDYMRLAFTFLLAVNAS